jgi:deoxyribose-phosphate aldolase
MDRYKETFSKFSAVHSVDELINKVNAIVEKHYDENKTVETLKLLHGCIDLTSLKANDTRESVLQMVNKSVNDYEGTHPDVDNIAAICVYPLFVETVRQSLTAKDVKVSSVAGGFPSSQTFAEIKIAEAAMAVFQGADEIEVVMNLGYFFEEDYEAIADELSEIKESCRGASLKVILETAALSTPENIRKASILALYSGADFIKTSTGKEFGGATPEAVYVMCRVLKEYSAINGRKAGIKIAGGVRSVDAAIRYFTIVKHVLGDSWLNKSHFRIGASSLLEELESCFV